MSLTCFTCGKEMGDYTGEAIKLAVCPACKAAPFYRSAANPDKLLRDVLMYGEYSDILGLENDAGATRIYVGSREALEQGMVLMHYIRSEEVPFDAALKERLKWPHD